MKKHVPQGKSKQQIARAKKAKPAVFPNLKPSSTAVSGPLAMLGYGRKLRDGPARRTSDMMRELREGEKPT
jgi:hypothetical protein